MPWLQGIPKIGHSKPLSVSISSDAVFSNQKGEEEKAIKTYLYKEVGKRKRLKKRQTKGHNARS